jgi:hypothetical protein
MDDFLKIDTERVRVVAGGLQRMMPLAICRFAFGITPGWLCAIAPSIATSCFEVSQNSFDIASLPTQENVELPAPESVQAGIGFAA